LQWAETYHIFTASDVLFFKKESTDIVLKLKSTENKPESALSSG
jgi:hypothetical protein